MNVTPKPKRVVTARGTATRVMQLLANRSGLITSADIIAEQLQLETSQVQHAVSYLRNKKSAPIEVVGNGAYVWHTPTNVKPLPDAQRELVQYARQQSIPLGGQQRHIDEAVLNDVPGNSRDRASTCDFVVIKRSGDVLVLQSTHDDTLWVARKL